MMPDLFIEVGPRAILSLIGIVTIISGVWYIDRTWDEKGSEAYDRARANSPDPNNVTIPTKDLDAAFPFPIAFLIGWGIFAISYLFPSSGDFSIELSASSIVAIVFSVLLGIIASVPMGDAVRFRKADKKMKLSMFFLLSWIGLMVSSALATGNGAPSFVFGSLGVVSIVASMRILWKHRKMGDSWEKEGRPNPNPVVYNMGGPLFVFGWFLFWVAMASTNQGSMENGIPFYFNWRTALAFFAGVGMVPVVMMIDYAHDEGGKYVGFGTDGSHFGRFLETPIPFITMWILFALSSFLSLNNAVASNMHSWLLLVNSSIQAVVAGIFIQTALYKGNMPLKNKLSMIFVLLFLTLALNIGFNGGVARYLAFVGVIFVVAGQMTVFGDRKRGDYWMQNNAVNPNPIVYSIGEPLFMSGWIMLATAMSAALI